MTQKPISRDRIERQKFKDRLNSKIDLALNPSAPSIKQLPQSIIDRRQREAQQKIEIQARADQEAQKEILKEQLLMDQKRDLSKTQQDILLAKRQQEVAKSDAASLVEQERRAVRAGILGELEKAAKDDSERLEAMRVKSIAILEGKRRQDDDTYNEALDLEIGLVNRRILERRLKL